MLVFLWSLVCCALFFFIFIIYHPSAICFATFSLSFIVVHHKTSEYFGMFRVRTAFFWSVWCSDGTMLQISELLIRRLRVHEQASAIHTITLSAPGVR